MASGSARGEGARAIALPRVAIDRPRLVERLDKIPPGGLGLVVAPAGSGKSVLIGQWARSVAGATVSVHAVTDADADPAVFARHLARSLPVRPSVQDRLTGLTETGGTSLGGRFVEAALDALAQVDQPHVLVLDDVHGLTGAGLVADLRGFVAGLPPAVRLVVGSRWDPALDLSRLRLDGRVVEVRAADLAFDVPEARRLVGAVAGTELSEEDGAALVERTDGWAVGLQLAGLSLQGVADVGATVRAFAGDGRLVAEYLTTEVLERQTAATRSFLLRTSVLDRLEPELCAAVAGGDGDATTLDDLAERSLPLVQVGRHTYRYHHLFADLLRYRLRVESPDEWTRAHATAAAWLLSRDRPAEAVEHLLAGGDAGGAFEAIDRAGQSLFEQGRSATLLAWLERLAPLLAEPSPELDLRVLAACAASDRSTLGAEAHRRAHRSGAAAGTLAAVDALYATLVQTDLSTAEARRSASDAVAALEVLGPADVPDFLGVGGRDSVDIIARFARGFANLLDGRTADAEGEFAALTSHPGTTYPVWRVSVNSGLALCQALRGACSAAAALARATTDAAREAGVVHHPSVALSHLALAKVASLREEREAAAQALADVEACIGRTGRLAHAGLVRLVRAEHTAVVEGPTATLRFLDDTPAPGHPAALATGWETDLRVRMHVRRGEALPAAAILARAGDLPHLDRARIDVLLAGDDVESAAVHLDRWDPSADDVLDRVRRSVRVALVHQAGGETAPAARAVSEAVALAEVERLRRPFTECPPALALLRAVPLPQARAFVSSVLAVPSGTEARAAAGDMLVEPLTERELTVLEYLPTRLSNSDIAGELYVSVNTMKTHLRNVYRKLGVADRDAAVARAAEIGLL